MRAGNSTKVFFIIDDNIFGPVSNKGSVVKNFSIDPKNLGLNSRQLYWFTYPSKDELKNFKLELTHYGFYENFYKL